MRSESHQRGVVLIFALIVLLILAVGAVALLRSMNTSMVTAGNLAFHRDLVNQGEQAVSNVLTEFKTAAAPLSGLTSASNVNANYSAIALTTNPNGVPLALLNQTTFNTVGIAANDIAGATSMSPSAMSSTACVPRPASRPVPTVSNPRLCPTAAPMIATGAYPPPRRRCTASAYASRGRATPRHFFRPHSPSPIERQDTS